MIRLKPALVIKMSDLIINEGDLVLVKGDIAVQNLSQEVVAASLSRRIRTTANKYALMLIDEDQVINIDTDYGSDIQDNLSAPAQFSVSNIQRRLIKVVEQESRVIANNLSVVQPNPYTIKVTLDYSFNNNNYTLEI